MKLRDFLFSLHLRISAIVLFGISIILTQIPLFNYLGYEFSFIIALTISVLSGLTTIGLFRKFFTGTSQVPLTDFMVFQKENLSANFILLAVPLVVITLNLLVVKNCSFGEGIAFYGLIPFVTLLFSVTLASLCCTLFKRRRTAYLIILGVLGLLHPLWLGYFTPQIYSYNFLYGFFPGFSHDEVLTITPELILFRAITLLAAVWLFGVACFFVQETYLSDRLHSKLLSLKKLFSGRVTAQKGALFGLLLFLVCTWLLRISIGFESSSSSIRKKLGSEFRTDHFRIYYARDSFSDEEIRWASAEHEFRFRQVGERLHVSFPTVIESYIYPTEEVKRRLIGTGTTSIAKPWRHEIHLNKDSWQYVLKHELAHVLAGEFGMPIIRANLSTGLLEGLAMAVEWDFGNRTLHEYAAAMRHFGLMHDVSSLMSFTGFVRAAPTVSYVLCGSFCRFLIDRYGIVRFKDVYRGRSFRSVYEKDIPELIGEWSDFLKRIRVPEHWASHVKFYFDRKTIFSTECARQIAKLNRQASHELDRGNFMQAMRLYGSSLGESWNSEAFSGLVRTAYAVGRYDTVVQLIDGLFADPMRNDNVQNLLLLYGDALWSEKQFVPARNAYEDYLGLDLSESLNETAAIRKEVIDDPLLRVELQPVFLDNESDSSKLAVVEKMEKRSSNPIIFLLDAKMHFRLKHYDRTRQILEGRLIEFRNSSLANILDAAREKLLGMCCFHLRDFQQARVHFWQAMNFTSGSAPVLRLNEWIDRCEWFAVNASKYLDSR